MWRWGTVTGHSRQHLAFRARGRSRGRGQKMMGWVAPELYPCRSPFTSSSGKSCSVQLAEVPSLCHVTDGLFTFFTQLLYSPVTFNLFQPAENEKCPSQAHVLSIYHKGPWQTGWFCTEFPFLLQHSRIRYPHPHAHDYINLANQNTWLHILLSPGSRWKSSYRCALLEAIWKPQR